ncbi:hypothetical protein PYJP_04280 [Pyrofollis japonicus]|uniref:NUDIX hydrolase n=1 Tax=Pyrofollis japonicus TaxID=3060460 RepID=UPI00295AE26F|nr:NUDIX domain-containing protein [Pyrofollis japonicus]BEP17076.1 hypothetical protein PYJP_04280 [Pyrofollis japonicus]
MSARCIIIRDGKILLQLSKKGDFYRLPGGRVKPEETIVQALERELREELGIEKIIDPELLFIVESFYRRHSGVVHEIGFYFGCDKASIDFDKIVPKENHLRIEWVPLEKVNQHNLRPSALAPYLVKLGESKPEKPIYIVNVDVNSI